MTPREAELNKEREAVLAMMRTAHAATNPQPKDDYGFMDAGLRVGHAPPGTHSFHFNLRHQHLKVTLEKLETRLLEINTELLEISGRRAKFLDLTLEEKINAIAEKVGVL